MDFTQGFAGHLSIYRNLTANCASLILSGGHLRQKHLEGLVKMDSWATALEFLILQEILHV